MRTVNVLKISLFLVAVLTAGADSLAKEKKNAPTELKEFYVFDAINFRGKPDDYMSSYGFSPIKQIYENALLTSGDIDWKKVNDKIRECKQQGCKTISLDIEKWYWSKFKISSTEIKYRLDSIITAFHKAIPGCEIGNFGVPVDNLNVLRGWWTSDLEKTEENVVARWQKSNELREPSGAVCDIMMPSLYTYGLDMELWIKDFNATIDRIQMVYPGKKIYVYLWPQCYNAPDNPDYMKYIGADNLYKMLEEAYKRVDGAIIWTSTHSNMRNKVLGAWEDRPFQDTYLGVLKFNKKYKIKVKQ